MADRRPRIINQKPFKERRRNLRHTATPAEATLWKLLSGRKLDGRKFRRQQSIGPYIVDFYCPAEKLVIELDGAVHDYSRRHEYDSERQEYLEHLGFSVLRFENKMVFERPDLVTETIRLYFGNNKPPAFWDGH